MKIQIQDVQYDTDMTQKLINSSKPHKN